MSEWVPELATYPGARYAAIVDALADDIRGGRVKPGARLPTQRDMAERLGLSVGTVSKAYSQAEQLGLISGEVGRGTFVRHPPTANGRTPLPGPVNLALNAPPPTGEDKVISTVLAEVAGDGSLEGLLGYLPHQGRPDHREAIASWMAGYGMVADADRTFITHGAQHGLEIAVGTAVRRGGVVLTESFTYSGMLALSGMAGYRLVGVACDEHGLIPDELDRAFAATGARVLYCMPTLQTPTTVVMPLERRRRIAEIVARHEASLVEDDAYAFLFEESPLPISSLIPDRSFYVVSFAKCLAPGLRIGGMVVPAAYRDRCINAIRATGWMAAPVMAEVVSRLVRNGGLEEQARLKRAAAKARTSLAQRVLKEWLPEPARQPGFHLWLPMPAGRTITALVTQAAQAGVTVAPPGTLRSIDPADLGIRLCLGAPATETELEQALLALRGILLQPESISFV